MANPNLSCAITQLSVTPNNVISGSTVDINISFSDKSCPIEPGDSIQVSWPSTGQAYLNAYNQTFSLIDAQSNLVLANVVVSSGHATITFTQNVPKLQNISGNVKFKAAAWNVTEGTAENIKTIDVKSGDKSIPVTITKPQSTDEPSEFYSKTGSIWPNDTGHIYWYLNTNTRRENVEEPITLIDKIQPGQSIVPDSFMIYNTSNNEYYQGANAIADFEAAHPDSSISYNLGSSTITIKLSPFTVNGVNWIIVFKTQMTNLTQQNFSNNSSINYWVKGSPTPEALQSNASINNPYADGNISGAPAGTLIIKKLLDRSANNAINLPISGVSFKLSRVDGAPITPSGETAVILTTDIAGEAKIPDMVDGEYQLVETHTPDWLNPAPSPITFSMTNSNAQGIIQTIKNTKKITSVSATKVWHTTESTPPQVWFKLYRSNNLTPLTEVPNAPIKALAPGTTQVTWSDLDLSDDVGNLYTYTVKEVNAQGEDFTPLGYKKSEEGLSVINTYENQTTSLQVSKNWVDQNNQDGMRPASVTINLLANGKPTGQSTTLNAATWQYKWTNLPVYQSGEAVSYSVQETPIPNYETSYQTSPDGSITITNTHTPLTTSMQVSKVWADNNNQDGMRPTSVSVTLLADDQPTTPVATLSAANTWQYKWSDLPVYKNGKKITYTVQEATISGYQPSYQTSPDGSFTITNTHAPLTTSVNISKVWADYNNQDGLRPTSVSVTLLADNQPTLKPEILSDTNNWKYQWSNLPVYKEGKMITYTVQETPIPNYETSYENTSPDAITITNTHTPLNISMQVSKVWNDNDNQDGMRPTSISVTLLSNGQPSLPAVTLSANNNWQYTWPDLPVNQDGQKITYTVQETAIPNYQTSYANTSDNLITITNTHTPLTTSMQVSKVWSDNNNQDGMRPTSVSVTLLADNQPSSVETLSAANDWQYKWSNLPVYKAGQKITYTVQEAAISGYQPSYQTSPDGSFTITNTHTPLTTSVTVSKVWNDYDNQDGLRPASVSVTLLADGQSTPPVATLSTDNTWKYTWDNLPVYKAGKKITYTIQETPIPQYETSYQNVPEGTFTITNTHTPATTSMTVSKVWNDNNNQDGMRPNSVSVTLLADGQPTLTPETLSNTNDWKYTWPNLPVYKGGQKITYTVQETSIPQYETTYQNTSPDVITITNTHTPLTTSMQVSKVWKDNNNQDGMRPESVSVTLLSDGQPSLPAVTLASNNNWQNTWSNLPIYKDGQKITYTVQETSIPQYETSYANTADNTITITNTHTPLTTSMTVSKVWNDNDNQDGIRPASVPVTLLTDGRPSSPIATLSNANGWKYTWSNLPLYQNGQKITYTVQEAPTSGYEPSYTTPSDDAITITNTHTPATTSMTVSKVWNDNDNQDGLRPASVSVTLLADGQSTTPVATLSAANTWKYTWDNLPVYKAGTKITYTVQETPIPQYETTYQDVPEGTFTITNTHTPLTTSVNISKVWDDANNQDGLRPDSVSVTLLANGQSTSSTTTLSADKDWQYNWTDLPMYKDGQKITYSVQEVPITDYQTSYQTSPDGAITITNTHTPATTSLTVSKLWDDHNNQDGMRPTSVTVNLLADGQSSLPAVSLSATNDWQYKWSDLPVYKEGKKITYSIQETTIPEYETSYQTSPDGSYIITNTHTPLTTSVQTSKVWEDNNNQDGMRPASVSVTLLADGQPSLPAVTLSANNNWQYTWPNLPVYQEGKKITYSVHEASIPNYETSYQETSENAITITNTHTPLTTSVQVSKVWDDANNQDGMRPASISVTLLTNGQPSSPIATLSAANNWQYEWPGLPVYKNGEKITYTVKEAPIPDYETSYQTTSDGALTITNTHTPLTTSMTVSKTWVDHNNQDGLRPDSVSVTLLENGVPSTFTTTLSAANDWQYTWSNLPMYKDGKPITYTVKETPVPDYTTSYQSSPDGSVAITNVPIPLTTSLQVSKVWDDHNNQDGMRPTSIAVTLLTNGQPSSPIGTLSANNNWQYKWDNLPIYQDGKKVTYTVQEAPVPGYQASYQTSPDGSTVITNTHTPLTTSLQVSKIWDDNDNQDGIRPTSIAVTLLTNGQPSSPIGMISADNNWQYKWYNLPVYQNGKKVTYTVQEAPVPGYQASYQTSPDGSTIITNTHTPLTTSLQVSKIWRDHNNQAGLRPDSVSVTLLANGQPVLPAVTLTANNNWQYQWTHLPVYNKGMRITYSIEETPVPRYQTSYAYPSYNTIAILNTLTCSNCQPSHCCHCCHYCNNCNCCHYCNSCHCYNDCNNCQCGCSCGYQSF